jgi:hypothetical protein
MNSLVLDYCARQIVGGTHLTFGYLAQLPVLPATAYSETERAYIASRVLELSYTSWSIRPFARDLGFDGPPFTWDETHRCAADGLGGDGGTTAPVASRTVSVGVPTLTRTMIGSTSKKW